MVEETYCFIIIFRYFFAAVFGLHCQFLCRRYQLLVECFNSLLLDQYVSYPSNYISVLVVLIFCVMQVSLIAICGKIGGSGL